MRKVMLLMYVMVATSCTKDIIAPVEPQIKKQEEYVPPYTHPKFVRDTTWVEEIVGMQFWPEDTGWTLDVKPWSYQTVTDTNDAIRKGWKSQRFEVRTGDCLNVGPTATNDCNRKPVWERREFGENSSFATEGQEYWYGWSFYAPANNNNSLGFAYITQFQQLPNNNPIFMFFRKPSTGLCVLLNPEKYAWRNASDCVNPQEAAFQIIDEQSFFGMWHDIVVHAIWAKDSTGVFQVWVNDVLKLDYRGYTMTKDAVGIPMKYGIYRIRERGTSIVYFDEVRRGITRSEVDIRLLER